MNKELLPHHLPNITEKIYSGFWQRFGAFWLDAIISIPVTVAIQIINNQDRLNYFYTIIPSYLFFFFYYIYCVKRWGGTPGKLICGIIIIKKAGTKAGWKEAILRHAVSLALGILFIPAYIMAITQMTNVEFSSLTFLERSGRIVELMPYWHQYANWANQIWMWSEFIVILTNYRRRALHDFIAGTVVIKKKYRKEAEQWNSDVQENRGEID
jgi:uncharacterized RDD family membrane protein YckC